MEIWGLHLESSRQDPKNTEIQTLKKSVKDPSNGPCALKNWQGNELRHCTRTCTQLQVRASNVFQLLRELRKRYRVVTLSKSDSTPVIMTANGTAHTTEEAAVFVCDLDMFV